MEIYSIYDPASANMLRDNNFDNFVDTFYAELTPWFNILLPESAWIAAVFLFNRQDSCCIARLWWTSIRIGDDALPANNPECVGNIDRDGMYVCLTEMKGTYVGITRA